MTEGKLVDHYTVEPVPSDWGLGFKVRKLSGPEDKRRDYCCLIERQGGQCECLGFLRWRECRHLEALAQLLERGLGAARWAPAVEAISARPSSKIAIKMRWRIERRPSKG
jgi:hypothetical protein